MPYGSDSDDPIGYADAPREKWSNPDEKHVYAPEGPSAPPRRYGTTGPTRTWGQIQGMDLFTFEEETRARVREELARERERDVRHAGVQRPIQRLSVKLMVFGFVGFIALMVIAITLSKISAQKLDKIDFRQKSSAGSAAELATIITAVEFAMLIIFLPCFYSCGDYLGLIVFTAVICIEAVILGALLIFRTKLDLDDSICDGLYHMGPGRCWDGLKMGMAAGVVRLLLVPVGAAIWKGCLLERKWKKTKNYVHVTDGFMRVD